MPLGFIFYTVSNVIEIVCNCGLGFQILFEATLYDAVSLLISPFLSLCLRLIILSEECEWVLYSSLSECSVHPIRVMFVLFSDEHNHSFICAVLTLGRAACVLSARRIRKGHNCACSPPLSPTTNSTMPQSGT